MQSHYGRTGTPYLTSGADYTPARCDYLPSQRIYSTSPRREYVHHAEPIVERVVEQVNMVTPELLARVADARTEAEAMRVRMQEFEKLVGDHRILNGQYSDQCAENFRIRADFDSKHASNCNESNEVNHNLNSGKHRLENIRRHIDLLKEQHKRNTDNIAERDAEITKVNEELEKLATDSTEMTTRHREQVDELNQGIDDRRKTEGEIHDEVVTNNRKTNELHNLEAQVRSTESQAQYLTKGVQDMEAALENRTKEVEEYEARLKQLQAEIADQVAKIASTEASIQIIVGLNNAAIKENQGLTDKIHETSAANCKASADINDLLVRTNHIENRISCLKSETKNLEQSNGFCLDDNSKIQAELDAMKNHKTVLEQQNTAFTDELKAMADANEVMRQQLNRRDKAIEMYRRNDDNIHQSAAEVHRNRSQLSPVRRQLYHPAPPLYNY